MKPVICFGEALIDLLLFNSEVQEGLDLAEFRQYPGGAPANAAVAVAKLGGEARFAGQVGDDPFGHFLAKALQNYGVDTRFLHMHEKAKTALAFVLLDEHGERSFSFHRHETADVVFNKSQVSQDWFQDSPIVHFCSNTLTDKNIADCTQYVVAEALRYGSFISFDVNLRHNLWPEKRADIKIVNQLVYQSHLIKFSREEFDYLSEGDAEAYRRACLSQNCQLLLITDGAKPVEYYGRHVSGQIFPPEVKAVDTTAGGDGFVGGLLLLLSCLQQPDSVFHTEDNLEAILQFASGCGACAVTEKGAFPALPDRKKVTTLLDQNNQDLSFATSLLNTSMNGQ